MNSVPEESREQADVEFVSHYGSDDDPACVDALLQLATPRRFSDYLINAYIQAVLEWTREHHPERLTAETEAEQ